MRGYSPPPAGAGQCFPSEHDTYLLSLLLASAALEKGPPAMCCFGPGVIFGSPLVQLRGQEWELDCFPCCLGIDSSLTLLDVIISGAGQRGTVLTQQSGRGRQSHETAVA